MPQDHNPDRIFLDDVWDVRISTTVKDGGFHTFAYTSGAIIKPAVLSSSYDEAAKTHLAFVEHVRRTCHNVMDF